MPFIKLYITLSKDKLPERFMPQLVEEFLVLISKDKKWFNWILETDKCMSKVSLLLNNPMSSLGLIKKYGAVSFFGTFPLLFILPKMWILQEFIYYELGFSASEFISVYHNSSSNCYATVTSVASKIITF